jgi:hypothetical protein
MHTSLPSFDSSPQVDTARRGMTTSATLIPEDTGALWDTRDVASFIGCSERQVARLRDEGLPCVRVGCLVRFVPARVMAWLDGRQAPVRCAPNTVPNLPTHTP